MMSISFQVVFKGSTNSPLFSRIASYKNLGMSVDDKIHWALTHGIAIGLNIPDVEFASKAPIIHAPFTLDPFPFPKNEFEKAVGLAQLFNVLVEKITRNSEWLIETLEPTAVSDLFILQLLKIYKTVLDEGIKQPYSLAINRSDYMLHSKEGDNRTLLQVELNTIASSFGSLSTKITEMHIEMNAMESLDTENTASRRDIPVNSALDEIASGIAAAHQVYLSQTGLTNLNCSVAMIVQPNERNFADQRFLQYQLWKNHKVRCFRVTLAEVHLHGKLGSNNELIIDAKYVSVVYFRAGYSPDDLPSEKEWSARLLIERSFAIKCPTIAVHLAGCKKVQQALADPGILEMFISSAEQIEALRSVFAGLYSLSEPVSSDTSDQSQLLNIIKEKVQADNGLNFVMKPQREGGGNNFYGPDVAEALRTMSLDEQASYILMERILPPSSQADLVRDGKVSSVCYRTSYLANQFIFERIEVTLRLILSFFLLSIS